MTPEIVSKCPWCGCPILGQKDGGNVSEPPEWTFQLTCDCRDRLLVVAERFVGIEHYESDDEG